MQEVNNGRTSFGFIGNHAMTVPDDPEASLVVRPGRLCKLTTPGSTNKHSNDVPLGCPVPSSFCWDRSQVERGFGSTVIGRGTDGDHDKAALRLTVHCSVASHQY